MYVHRYLYTGLHISLVVIFTLVNTSISYSKDNVEEVRIYSTRQEHLIGDILDKFTKNSDIKVRAVYGKSDLLERIVSDGKRASADIFLTSDAGLLHRLKEKGLSQGYIDADLKRLVPTEYRDQDGHWWGLSLRARLIYASRERVRSGEVSRYEDLGQVDYKICTRSGSHSYNIGLLASIIVSKGLSEAESWLRGVKDKLGRAPSGNDRAQIKGVADGICDLALANSYYYQIMLSDPKQAKSARAVYPIFPNQQDRGTHINISGISLLKHSKNRENGIKLIKFLASKEIQQMYVRKNHEWAVNSSFNVESPADNLLWHNFKKDNTHIGDIVEKFGDALELVYKVGYNQ